MDFFMIITLIIAFFILMLVVFSYIFYELTSDKKRFMKKRLEQERIESEINNYDS